MYNKEGLQSEITPWQTAQQTRISFEFQKNRLLKPSKTHHLYSQSLGNYSQKSKENIRSRHQLSCHANIQNLSNRSKKPMVKNEIIEKIRNQIAKISVQSMNKLQTMNLKTSMNSSVYAKISDKKLRKSDLKRLPVLFQCRTKISTTDWFNIVSKKKLTQQKKIKNNNYFEKKSQKLHNWQSSICNPDYNQQVINRVSKKYIRNQITMRRGARNASNIVLPKVQIFISQRR